MFSREYCKILKNTFFIEQFLWLVMKLNSILLARYEVKLHFIGSLWN